jgi:hypothetical protein
MLSSTVGAQVRFKGGASRQMRLSFPQPGWGLGQTKPEIIAEIDRVLADHTEGEIARIVNERGYRSGTGLAWCSV